MAKKPFEKSLYTKFDKSGKKQAVEFLTQCKGYSLQIPLDEQVEKYKYDLVMDDKNGLPQKIEVEVKTVWETTKFPYPTIHVPWRKKNSEADVFIMFNHWFTSLLITPMKTILESLTVFKATRNRYTGTSTKSEKFFEFYVSQADFYYREENNWFELLDEK